MGKEPAPIDVKVDKWDGAALKNALDDEAKRVMIEHYRYVESHRMMDGRLFICTIAVGFAGFALIWDYLKPFPVSKPVLIICVASYFVMMGILTLYTSLVERGSFVTALDKDKAGIDPPNVWQLASQLKRYDDEYTLFLTYKNGITKATRTSHFTRSVSAFFDVNGRICGELFAPEVMKLHTSLSEEKKSK